MSSGQSPNAGSVTSWQEFGQAQSSVVVKPTAGTYTIVGAIHIQLLITN